MCLILLMAEDRVDGVYLYSFVIRTRTPRHDHLYTNTGIHVVSCPAAHYQTWNIRCFHHKQHSTCFLFFAWQMTNIVTVSTCPPSSGSKYPRQKTKYDVGTYCDFTCLKELAHEDLVTVSTCLPSSGLKYPHPKNKVWCREILRFYTFKGTSPRGFGNYFFF